MWRNLKLMSVCLWGLTLMLASQTVLAELVIRVTQGLERPTSIAVVPFAWSDNQSIEDIAGVVGQDLESTGRFKSLPPDLMLSTPHKRDEVFFPDWRAQNVDYLLIGSVEVNEEATSSDNENEEGNKALPYKINYEVYDVYASKEIVKGELLSSAEELRYNAHQLSNDLYRAIVGRDSYFNAQLLYVRSVSEDQGEASEDVLLPVETTDYLVHADLSGAELEVIVESNDTIHTPAWSPDGSTIVYVVVNEGHSVIHSYDVKTQETAVVADFSGLNSSPSWSPDSNLLAMTLSKDGNPEIYIKNMTTGELTRITDNPGIDTEASWFPDGKQLLFTSNRKGVPTLYRVDVNSDEPPEALFDETVNITSGQVLPDGSGVVMVRRVIDRAKLERYVLVVLDLETKKTRTITLGPHDDHPSVSPDGSLVIYDRYIDGRDQLTATGVDTAQRARLPSGELNFVRDAVWVPVNVSSR